MSTSAQISIGEQSTEARYSPSARALHWITVLLVFTTIPLGWIFAEYKTTPGPKEYYQNAHKTIGLIIFAIVIARLVSYWRQTPPRLPVGMASWQVTFAKASHWLLYLVLLVMPVSGYIMSSAGKFPISFLGFIDVPKLAVSKPIGEIAKQVHIASQFVLFTLVILHVGAIVWHLVYRRDDILSRMLPAQINKGT